jgi:hypothetical protein
LIWCHKPILKNAASNIPIPRKRNEFGRNRHRGRNQFCEVHPSQIVVEGEEVHIAEGDTTIATVTGTAIEELPAVRLTTTFRLSQGCLRTCQHKKLGFNGKPKHSCTMIFTPLTLSYKRKRIAYDCNCILSHSRPNRVRDTHKSRDREIMVQLSSKPRIEIEPIRSTIRHLSQRLSDQICSSIRCTTRDNRSMDTKHRARILHPHH